MATPTQSPNPVDRALVEHVARVNGNSAPTAGTRAWHESMLTGIALTALLAVVAIVASLIALSGKSSTTTTVIRQAGPTHASAANTSGAAHPTGAGLAVSGAGAVVPMVLQLDATKGTPGTVTGIDGWPRYAPSTITVPAGKPVTLTITNYDDANTPLGAGSPYNTVQGGRETVNGKPVTFVNNKMIAHTFTIPALHVNAAIPMETAGAGLSNTVTFTFTPHKRGTYTFQCFTPCGTGKNGVGGPMMKPGFMQGTLIVS
jgi:Cupredoxin-like domain